MSQLVLTLAVDHATPGKAMFGDWTPGRYAWEIANVKMIDPIPASGRQGLWTWNGEPFLLG